MTIFAPWKRQPWGLVAHRVTSDGGTLCGLQPTAPGELREWLPPVPGDRPDRTGICATCQWIEAGKPLGPIDVTEPLFGPPDPPTPAAPAEVLGRDARRTLHQRELLEAGRHPATKQHLHPDAPRITTAHEDGHGPRCGSCRFLTRKNWGEGRGWFKCHETPYAYDMRSWWPGCHLWQPKETA